MDKHTPTPWTVYGWEHSEFVGIQPVDSDGITGPIIADGKYGVTQANAAYIVRAVNAYGPTVEALKEAQKIISIARRYFPKSIKNTDKFSLENTCACIGSALALAEARS